jgi:hypothetical protein
MADVTVDLEDLKELVRLLLDASIEARTSRAMFVRLQGTNPEDAQKVRLILEFLAPEAQRSEEEIHHNLLASLESGSDVHGALKRFVDPRRRRSSRRRSI